MTSPLRVLVLEDVPEDAETVRALLERAGFRPETRRVTSREGFETALRDEAFDLVLADDNLPRFDAAAALALARALRPEIPFIVVSGALGEDTVIDLLQKGATDYVLQDRIARLVPAVRRALHEAEAHARRRKAEEGLLLQQQMMLRTEHLEAISSLVAGVAHELNNPLALLVGHATLLRRKAGEGPLADRADKIAAAAERCARIVRNFVALARRNPPETRPVDLARLVRETLEILAYGLRVDAVEVVLDLPRDLPSLTADPDRLRRLLVNLVMNAQASLRGVPGKRRLTVGAAADPQAPVVRLAVEDNGPGVPEDIRERVFEPFFSTKAPAEGTGMGLALCRGIVTDHGGELRLETPPGGGARFVAELPLAPPGPVPETLAAAPPIPPGPCTILVVDDEPELAHLIGDALEQAGHAVDRASTAAAAFERLAGRRYDLVVSDLRMPEMDGPHLYREVARRYPDLARRFVFVTGDSLAPEIAAFVRSIAAPVVSKPFESEDLVNTANHVLATQRGTP